MTTSTQTGMKVYSISTAAEFCAAGRKMRDALDAVGLTKTGDTGQVDFDADAATSGYEVREFGDVFFKIAYSISTNAFAGQWNFGTGTNGSGTLTGSTSAATYGPSASTSSHHTTEFKTLRIASDAASYLMFYLSHGTSTYSPSRVFVAQSVPPLTGHPLIAQGYFATSNSNSTALALDGSYRWGDSPTGSMGAVAIRPPIHTPPTDLSAWGSVDPAEIEVFVPKWRWSKAQAWFDFLPIVYVWVGEIPNDTPFTVNINGTNRTYITHSQFVYGNGLQQAYLWE